MKGSNLENWTLEELTSVVEKYQKENKKVDEGENEDLEDQESDSDSDNGETYVTEDKHKGGSSQNKIPGEEDEYEIEDNQEDLK